MKPDAVPARQVDRDACGRTAYDSVSALPPRLAVIVSTPVTVPPSKDAMVGPPL